MSLRKETFLTLLIPLFTFLFLPFLAWIGFACLFGHAETYGYPVTIFDSSVADLTAGGALMVVMALFLASCAWILLILLLSYLDPLSNKLKTHLASFAQALNFAKQIKASPRLTITNKILSSNYFKASIVLWWFIIVLFFSYMFSYGEAKKIAMHKKQQQYIFLKNYFPNQCPQSTEVSEVHYLDNGKYTKIYGYIVRQTNNIIYVYGKPSIKDMEPTLVGIPRPDLGKIVTFKC